MDWIEKEKRINNLIKYHKNVQRLIKPLRVIIPFSNHIEFPTDFTRNRRDFPRFLNLIKTVSFLRQYQKTLKKEGNTEYIKADLEDYKIAYELAKKLLASTLSPVSERARDVLRVILELESDEFSRADIKKKAKLIKVQLSPNNRTYANQLDSLVDIDAIEYLQSGPGKTYKYKKKMRVLSELEGCHRVLFPPPKN